MQAQEVLSTLLDKYADDGIENLEKYERAQDAAF
jgi:hypothetical protein